MKGSNQKKFRKTVGQSFWKARFSSRAAHE